MTYKNNKIVLLLPVLIVVFLFSGCDTHKDERGSLLKQKNEVEAEIVRLKSQYSQTSQNIESLASEINNQTESLQQHTNRHTKFKDDLAGYVLEHKLATLAVIAAGGGAATILNENLDEDTKSTLAVVVIIGAVYCVSNYEECADVTSKILYYGSQIDSEAKTITKLKSDISVSRAALEKNKQNLAALSKTTDEKTISRNSLQEKHDSLLCKFCF
jgi:septal ring factor EnvC (AmiA/AmiB activator)